MLHKHQRALHKYTLMKRQMSAAVHGREPESVEQLESRIVEVLGAGGAGLLAGPGAGDALWLSSAFPQHLWTPGWAVWQLQSEGWSPWAQEAGSVLAVTVHQAASKEAVCFAAGKCDPDDGAPEPLLLVLPAPGDAAGPHAPSPHLSHPRGLRQLPDPRAQGGGLPCPPPAPGLPLLQAWQPLQATSKNDVGELVGLG